MVRYKLIERCSKLQDRTCVACKQMILFRAIYTKCIIKCLDTNSLCCSSYSFLSGGYQKLLVTMDISGGLFSRMKSGNLEALTFKNHKKVFSQLLAIWLSSNHLCRIQNCAQWIIYILSTLLLLTLSLV